MVDKKYFKEIRVKLLSYASKRREVIKTAGDAQHHAKRAIFALQRDDKAGAESSLKQAEELLVGLLKRFKSDQALFDEGSYRASLEEYTEAALFKQFLLGERIGQVKGLPMDEDTFVGGLCDLPGELYRYAIKSATERKFEVVKKCYAVAEEIIGELMDMDLTGYNRNKFDQAKQALHKLEQVVYEVSLRT
jgi:predicted translin family RNA/ssDNA-binding protein